MLVCDIFWEVSNAIDVGKTSKIMGIFVKNGLNIRVIDSLNFSPMTLAKLPEAFGLDTLRKGFFPHFFNTEDNQNYLEPHPEAKMYGADAMSSRDRDLFEAWHIRRSISRKKCSTIAGPM